MYQLTRLELEHLYNVLMSVKEDDPDLFEEELEQAIEIVRETLNKEYI